MCVCVTYTCLASTHTLTHVRVYTIWYSHLERSTFLGIGRWSLALVLALVLVLFLVLLSGFSLLSIQRFFRYVFHFSFASQFEWKIDICLLCCCPCCCCCLCCSPAPLLPMFFFALSSRESRVESRASSAERRETRDVIRLPLYGHNTWSISLCSCELTVNANEQCHKCAIKNCECLRSAAINENFFETFPLLC